MPRLILETHELTRRAVERLTQLRQGQHVEWTALNMLLGLDTQVEGRHYVDSARRILLREQNRVYEVIPGTGVKWLTDAEVAKLGTAYTRRLGRMARRWRKKASAVNYRNLTQAEINQAMTSIAQAGFFEQAATAGHKQQIDPECKPPNGIPGIPFQMG